jgi:RNA polymerase sigma-70 factor (ECF subfamily)
MMPRFAPALPLFGSPVAILPARRAERLPAPKAGASDDSTVCEAALRGDPDAWNALVQRHNRRVVVTLLARGLSIDQAKDIAQEAWIRLFEQQRLGRLGQLRLPGLAIAQAAFIALEASRRDAVARRHELLDGLVMAAAVTDPQGDAELRLLTEERVERAVDALSHCSLSARRVFRLAYGGEGLSHSDVAERVGLSLQRVRQILCEVRARLRRALEGVEAE